MMPSSQLQEDRREIRHRSFNILTKHELLRLYFSRSSTQLLLHLPETRKKPLRVPPISQFLSRKIITVPHATPGFGNRVLPVSSMLTWNTVWVITFFSMFRIFFFSWVRRG
ncbi:hypothetical protein Pfo_024418 [Paulownia fortunei]|nr:hypothetical protein Pfo_024418 [Paulownia fortunei]